MNMQQTFELPSFGLGCMGLSEFYGKTNETESIAVLEKALELGIRFFDTADVYGFGANEELLGKVLKPQREQITIASKCGILRDRRDPTVRGVSNDPKYIQKSCEESLLRLGTDYIDLFYLHRVDSQIPFEESIGALAQLKEQGKIKAIGLSEVSTNQLRKAQELTPIAAVQNEYSLWTRDSELNGVLQLCEETGTSFVAYSPIGRGFLSGKIRETASLEATDARRMLPRFQEGNIAGNLALADEVAKLAKAKGCTAAQLSIAWVIHKGAIPIPGTKRIKYLEENFAAQTISISKKEMELLDSLSLKAEAIKGTRYPEAFMKAYDLE